jgi:type I pantothenate kinase
VLYDPLPDTQGRRIETPDLVLVEGVNALQPEFLPLYDKALYLHADEADLKRWYTERVQRVREEVRNQPDAYLHYLSQLPDEEFVARVEQVWEDVNRKNLHEHILPTKPHADLVVVKGANHELIRLESAVPHDLLFTAPRGYTEEWKASL